MKKSWPRSWPPWPPPETPARDYKMRLLRPVKVGKAVRPRKKPLKNKLKREGETPEYECKY